MRDINNILQWKIPRWLLALLMGLLLAGLVMPMIVVAFRGDLPAWTPWPIILVCSALTYWAMTFISRPERR